MTLSELRELTRLYTRDTNSYLFTESQIDLFLNQAINRLQQAYKGFQGMKKLRDSTDKVNILPEHYQYMLALFASSRLFDIDERFYEGIEKKNEFEQVLEDLISEIQSGNIELTNDDGTAIEDSNTYIEYIKDEYFNFNKYKDDDLYDEVDENV